MAFMILTGMSGAGKSKAVDALEDLGYFCVDNVPPQLLTNFTELNRMPGGGAERMAVVVDTRVGDLFEGFLAELDRLRREECPFKLLFLDADDAVLLRRYKEGRRKHPLLGGEVISIEEAIRRERGMLEQARQRADYVIDTSLMSTSQLKEQIAQLFCGDNCQPMAVQCMSFGFKNGLPKEADLVFDVRCLPNPFYVPELREQTGVEDAVRDYIMKAPESRELLQKLFDLVDFLIPLYIREGKSRLVVAVGCTGGRHRSVAFAQAVGLHLRDQGIETAIVHRDKDKPNQH